GRVHALFLCAARRHCRRQAARRRGSPEQHPCPRGVPPQVGDCAGLRRANLRLRLAQLSAGSGRLTRLLAGSSMRTNELRTIRLPRALRALLLTALLALLLGVLAACEDTPPADEPVVEAV